MSRLKLCLAIHNHQPVGNFGDVFEKAFDSCYQPFLDALERHPRVRVSLHYTGPLLEWLRDRRPELLGRLRERVAAGQIEILGGGFFEPILAVLPERDALGQIARMRAFCAEHLGASPDGLWLAERAWEPDLPRVLAKAGVRFTLLDDTAFLHAGLLPSEITGHFYTEKAGRAVALFPIDRRLRYLIPFKEPHEILHTLRELHGRGQRSVTYGDDGEKFGLWPGTADWVYARGWLERFFAALEGAEDFLELAHFSEALADPAAGRVYLPTASYEEMMEWTLPARTQTAYEDFRKSLERENRLDAVRAYVRGGIWQGFLAKYPEANALHKRMLLASERVAQAAAAHGEEAVREARDALYRSQCNDAYWHGLFGGLYARHLRNAAYRELLRAEALVLRLSPPEPAVRAHLRDYDCDGDEEVILDSPGATAIIAPNRGGAVLELDAREPGINLFDVLMRRVEGYHHRVAGASAPAAGDAPRSIHDLHQAKEAGLDRFLASDAHGRHGFLQHLFEPETSFAEIAEVRARAVVPLAAARFRTVEVAGGTELATVRLEHQADGILVGKTLSLSASGTLRGVWELGAANPRPVLFVAEVSIALPSEHDDTCFFDLGTERPGIRSSGSLGTRAALRVADTYAGLEVRFATSWDAEVWRHPIETVSQSEEGFERTFQGSVLLFCWRGTLGPTPQRFELSISVRTLT